MKLILTYLLAFIFFLPMAAFADLNDCLDESGEASYIHCTYVTGLKPNDNTEGRYLKIEMEHDTQKGSMTLCANNTLTSYIDPVEAEDLLGDTNMKISICSDKRGKKCELISNKTIHVTKKEGMYLAEPKLVEIALASYANRFPRCEASVSPEGDVVITQLRMMKKSLITNLKMMK
jgi:hypothetical protein